MAKDERSATASGGFIWLDHFADIAGDYDLLFCDIWGVVHNGVRAWEGACDALVRFRADGGKVALVTNAPRPAAAVRAMLDRLAVPTGAYDTIVTSGDLTRAEIGRHDGASVFHLGPGRDLSLFEGFSVRRVEAADAEFIVNTGLFDDENETPEDYRELLSQCRARDLPMVCANPDIVVERGDRLIHCAGALAELYQDMGGQVLWAGKPHAPVYDRALEMLNAGDTSRARMLAIGDSIRTDMTGAARYDIDGLFIAGGIHGSEIGRGANDRAPMEAAFGAAGVSPRAVMSLLVW
ncbi:MAG: TIGR01459 family HAD-type hydrolase [Rhodobiaceae bacterium]|nr:TIGR01459 family HAD-type hydrolase [Rhodobiaceae bacterium]MCC0054884.1 TIGR01459 family HAD-type hydrolase [Rhodobiaceae bacterium]